MDTSIIPNVFTIPDTNIKLQKAEMIQRTENGTLYTYKSSTTDYFVKSVESNLNTIIPSMFLKEIDMMNRLVKCSNIVKFNFFQLSSGNGLLGCSIITEQNFYATLHTHAPTVAQEVKEEYFNYIAFNLSRALRILTEKNFVHGNINPENVFLNVKNDRIVDILLGDFSSAVIVPQGAKLDVEKPMYKIGYRPPELMMKTPFITSTSDMWATAATLVYALTAKPLIENESDIVFSLDQLIGKKNVIQSIVRKGANVSRIRAGIEIERVLKERKVTLKEDNYLMLSLSQMLVVDPAKRLGCLQFYDRTLKYSPKAALLYPTITPRFLRGPPSIDSAWTAQSSYECTLALIGVARFYNRNIDVVICALDIMDRIGSKNMLLGYNLKVFVVACLWLADSIYSETRIDSSKYVVYYSLTQNDFITMVSSMIMALNASFTNTEYEPLIRECDKHERSVAFQALEIYTKLNATIPRCSQAYVFMLEELREILNNVEHQFDNQEKQIAVMDLENDVEYYAPSPKTRVSPVKEKPKEGVRSTEEDEEGTQEDEEAQEEGEGTREDEEEEY